MPFLKGISNTKSKWEVRNGKVENEVGSGNNLTSHLKSLASHLSLLTSFPRKWKFSKGFTLIELLIVMTIIAIMIGAATYSWNNARIKGRDGKRKTDLKAVQQALEMYFQTNGKYPAFSSGQIQCNAGGTDNGTNRNWGEVFTCNSINYMQQLPKDPISTNSYYFTSSGSPPLTYILSAKLENTNDPENKDNPNYVAGTLPCTPQSPRNYCVINP